MKSRIITLLLISFWITSINGQIPDQNWLIRNSGSGLELSQAQVPTLNYNLNMSNPGMKFIIDNVTPPMAPYTMYGIPVTPRNDYFAIFNDGSYSNITIPYSTISTTPNTENSHFDIGNKQIAYLYLTDIYEEDEPSESIRLGTNGNSAIYLASNLDGSTTVNSRKYGITYCANQDILHDDDITFIINLDEIVANNDGLDEICDNVQLCYSYPTGFDQNDFNFISSPFNTLGSNNILAGTNLAASNRSFDSGNCINLYTTTGNVFLNFRSNVEDETIINNKLKFYLQCNDSKEGTIHNFGDISISGFYHDPNFVELQCVWEENGKKYARYHVECFNSGNVGVDNISIGIDLPSQAIMSTIQLNKWMIGCEYGCDTTKGNRTMGFVKISGNTLEINFPTDLDLDSSKKDLAAFTQGGDSRDYTAWAEFCVELDGGTNIYTAELQPTAPKTSFDGTHYPIMTYKDDKKCLPPKDVKSIKDNKKLRKDIETESRKKNCQVVRVNTTKCKNCECCTSWWCKILVFLGCH